MGKPSIAARARAAGRRMRRGAFDAIFHGAAGLAANLPQVRDRLRQCRITENVAYVRRDGEVLALDVLQPLADGPHPVILYLHGGGFAVCSRETHRPIAAIYAARGYLVFNIDYRLAPRHRFPAALEDVCDAWSWIAENVERCGGDRERVVVAGESAGANLALSLMLCACTERPEPWAARVKAGSLRAAAGLLYCGFLQTSHPERYRRDGVSALAARIARDAAVDYLGTDAMVPRPEQALADPLCVVEAMTSGVPLPPLFIAAGGDDPVAPDSWRLADALARLGMPHRVARYPGETHAFHVMPWREAAKQCWGDSFRFLDEILAPNEQAGESRPGEPAFRP